MKEYIKKFESAILADGYVINDIPFMTTVNETPVQNLVCNETGKHLENNDGKVIVCPPDIVVPNAVRFTAQEANSTIGLEKLSSYQTLEYSIDLSNWSSMTTTTTITLANSGDSCYIRGVLSGNNADSNYTQFKMTGKIVASGNCNYLWNNENQDAPLKEYCGYKMFNGCTSLTTAPELPATTLANWCYQYMFYGCTSLTTAPELPATTLTQSCYLEMFGGCTSLTTTPELPATTLASSCYRGMFSDCTSLTTAPELPATTLANYCYYFMFYNCSKLNYIKCLATNISATYCTTNWVKGVASTGTFIKDANMTGWTAGANGIPINWTVEDAQ